jgi:hypothetical protein
MDIIQKQDSSICNPPSSEPFKIDLGLSFYFTMLAKGKNKENNTTKVTTITALTRQTPWVKCGSLRRTEM